MKLVVTMSQMAVDLLTLAEGIREDLRSHPDGEKLPRQCEALAAALQLRVVEKIGHKHAAKGDAP